MSGGAAVAKAKAVYGTLLKKEDYENLVHRNSVGTAVSYLKGTPRYGAVFSGYDGAALHRGQIEQLLGKSVFESYRRIRRFSAPGGGIMDFYLKEREAEQLSKAIAAVVTGTGSVFFPFRIICWIGSALTPKLPRRRRTEGRFLRRSAGQSLKSRWLRS